MQLLLTGAYAYSDEQFRELEDMGFTVHFVQDERIPLSEQPLDFDVEDIEAVACNGLFLYNDIADFKSLRFIQLTSAGLDRVPLDEIKSRSIELRNARGVYSIPMAEYAVCGALQLLKHARSFDEAQRAHEWRKDRTLGELFGRKVLVLGCGSVGTECAKRFKAFGCKVIGVDLFLGDRGSAYDEILPLGALDGVLPQSDVIVMTVPLTDETRNMLDISRLEYCKPEAILVNIARGGIIDEEALAATLKEGRLGGAVLDVFNEEPLTQENPLWDCKNVIITPHNSFVGEGNSLRMWEVMKANLLSYRATIAQSENHPSARQGEKR